MPEGLGQNGGIKDQSIESMRGGFTLVLPDKMGEQKVYTLDKITPEILNEARKKGHITEARFAEIAFVLFEKNQKEAQDLNTHNKLLEESRGIDTLTGISNLHGLNKRLNKLIEQLKYPLGPKSVMVVTLDINNFKAFNEKPYDHSIGDKALFEFASRLKEVTKESNDSAFRKGGDEFVLVMPIHEEGVDFEKLFTQIQDRVNKDLNVHVDGTEDITLTSSMGYAVLKKGESKTADQLLKQADEMERENKQKKKS